MVAGAGYTFALANVPTGYTNDRFVYLAGMPAGRKVCLAEGTAPVSAHGGDACGSKSVPGPRVVAEVCAAGRFVAKFPSEARYLC